MPAGDADSQPRRRPKTGFRSSPNKSGVSGHGRGRGGETATKLGDLCNILAYATTRITQRHRHSGIDTFEDRRIVADIEYLLAGENAFHVLPADHPPEQSSLAVVDGDADFAEYVGGRAQGRQRLCDLAQARYRIYPAHHDSARCRDNLWRPRIPVHRKINQDQIVTSGYQPKQPIQGGEIQTAGVELASR